MKKLVLTFAIVMFPLFVYSQNPLTSPSPKTLTEKEQRLRLQKLQLDSMVEKTAENAVFWEDKKTAVEVLADAANLMWNETPTQSAKWLTKAWQLIGDVSDTKKDGKLKDFFNRSEKSNLRSIVLRVAHEHDVKLFEYFLKNIPVDSLDEKSNKGAFDDNSARSEQLLRLAQQVVDTNPALAFGLAQRSLDDGISFSFQNILTSLRIKDPVLANRLFDLALSCLSRKGAKASEAQVLVGYLFRPGFTTAVNPDGQIILVVNPAQQNVQSVAFSEPIRTHDFLGVLFQSFFSRPIQVDLPENKALAENNLLLGQSVAGYYDRFAPELGQSVKLFVRQLQSQLYPNSQDPAGSSRTSNLSKNATKDEVYEALIADLEEKADNEANPISKKIAYVKAAIATRPNDLKRGVSIAAKIIDDGLQANVISFLQYRTTLYFVESKDIEKAEEIVPKNKDNLRRSVSATVVSQFLLTQRNRNVEEMQIDRQRAFELLTMALHDLKQEDVSTNSVKVLFCISSLLAKFDTTQSIVALEQAIRAINQIDKIDIKDTSSPTLGIEVFSASDSTVSIPRIGFGFRNAIEPLLENSFDDVLSNLERFSSKEIRGVSVLETAKAFYQKNKLQFIGKTRRQDN